jgi:adenylosuccinate synthase
MKSIVVVGAQWGDEGKGKVVDYMAASFEYIARCAGGHNAGHTVIFDGHRFILQLIPCGILRPERRAVIGTGVVVDPQALVAELDNLAKAGIGRWTRRPKPRAAPPKLAPLRGGLVPRTKTRCRAVGCGCAT